MALVYDTVMDHFMHPRNVGEIPQADGVGEVGNAKCGDIMKMYLKIKDRRDQDVKFETFGCGSAIASSSMATEMIKGRPSMRRWPSPTGRILVEALGGLHCSAGGGVHQSAIKNYYDRNGIEYDHSRFPG